MDIIELKFALMALILASAWIGGLIPLGKATSQSSHFLSLGNAFAAGIFLGIGLIHMLGDASDTWRTSLGLDYPVALLLAGVAFLLLLWFEHVALQDRFHDAVHAPGGIIPDFDHTTPSTNGTSNTEDSTAQKMAFYPYALIVALSIHSVIAGITLGAQTSLANVLLIFVAIAAHKSTAGFALGVSLARNAVPRGRALRLIGLFSVMTPIGIIVGLLVTNALEGRAQIIFQAVFLSLAAGSFIYIAAFDILRDEFLQPGPRAVKWILTVLGFGLMGLLALWL
ncbi:MAG: ZIP family metal transporter [Halioglobus sp.]|nr:ZIP family metal transporter [Halioglobus sp.]